MFPRVRRHLSGARVAVEVVPDRIDDERHHVISRSQQQAHGDVSNVLFRVPCRVAEGEDKGGCKSGQHAPTNAGTPPMGIQTATRLDATHA